MRLPGFIGTADRSQSPAANPELCMNWRIELLPKSSKNQVALYPTPGQTPRFSVSEVGTRALFDMNDRTFAVVATTLYELFASYTETSRGTIVQDNNQATITSNGAAGAELFITSGTNGYVLDLLTNTLTTELTGDATQGGMLDGYFIAFNKATSRIRISDLNDGTTWDPTQFAARGQAPDNWKTMVINAPDIWLIGEQTGEVWFDSGAFPFPLEPRPGANFKFGTAATFSAIAVGDSVIWLSRNVEGAGIVVEATGYTPKRISTPAVETRIAEYARTSTIDDAEAWTYQQEGHRFYVLRFPTAQATEVYDQTVGAWFTQGTFMPNLNRYDCWHPRVHCYAFGKHLVGESGTGVISELDVTIGTEPDGSEIRRMRVTPSVFNEHKLFLHRRLELYFEYGLGTSTGQGFNPTVMLESSEDGGKTYAHYRQGSIGKIGEYGIRCVFTRLGLSRDRVYRVTFSDPTPARLIDAFLNHEDAA